MFSDFLGFKGLEGRTLRHNLIVLGLLFDFFPRVCSSAFGIFPVFLVVFGIIEAF